MPVSCFFFSLFSEVKQPVSIAKTYNKSIEAMQNDTGILSENMDAVSRMDAFMHLIPYATFYYGVECDRIVQVAKMKSAMFSCLWVS